MCVVVGGGEVAARRVTSLRECGAILRVVARRLSEDMVTAGVEIRIKGFEPVDLEGAFLAIAAADDSAVNIAVAAACRDKGILCNDAETFERGDFVVPSTARQGDLILSVTTGGASPALSRRIRDQLLTQYGPEFKIFVTLLRELRDSVLHNIDDASRRREILSSAAEDDVALQSIREGHIQEARDRLFQCIFIA